MDSKDDPRQRRDDYNDPDLQNSEQNEQGTQAQDIAEEARHLQLGEESEPGGKANPADLVPRDVPDLVEKEEEMLRSGRIDMDAFEGEEMMDDEEE